MIDYLGLSLFLISLVLQAYSFPLRDSYALCYTETQDCSGPKICRVAIPQESRSCWSMFNGVLVRAPLVETIRECQVDLDLYYPSAGYCGGREIAVAPADTIKLTTNECQQVTTLNGRVNHGLIWTRLDSPGSCHKNRTCCLGSDLQQVSSNAQTYPLAGAVTICYGSTCSYFTFCNVYHTPGVCFKERWGGDSMTGITWYRLDWTADDCQAILSGYPPEVGGCEGTASVSYTVPFDQCTNIESRAYSENPYLILSRFNAQQPPPCAEWCDCEIELSMGSRISSEIGLVTLLVLMISGCLM